MCPCSCTQIIGHAKENKKEGVGVFLGLVGTHKLFLIYETGLWGMDS